jgi:hypothetical protein
MNKFDFEAGLNEDRAKGGVFGGAPDKFLQ